MAQRPPNPPSTPPPPPPPGDGRDEGGRGWDGGDETGRMPREGWPAPQEHAEPYPGHGYGRPPSNGVATAALIVGIVGLVLAFIPVLNLLGILLGLAAVVLGIVGIGKSSKPGVPGRGLAIGGLVTGLLALVVGIAWLALFGAVVTDPQFQETFRELQSEFERLPTEG